MTACACITGQPVAVIRHNARAILSCERVILNLLQRMSGIATATRRYVDAIAGTKCRILDTRKTAPGLRLIDKYAVRCGGGQNHRLDLSDGILVKNNHVDLAGGIREVLERAHRNRKGEQPIQVEVRSMAELEDALQYGAEAILLDNMTPEQVCLAVQRVAHHTRRVPLEASGGITLENVRAYAEAGVDYISVGALTHSPQRGGPEHENCPSLGRERPCASFCFAQRAAIPDNRHALGLRGAVRGGMALRTTTRRSCGSQRAFGAHRCAPGPIGAPAGRSSDAGDEWHEAGGGAWHEPLGCLATGAAAPRASGSKSPATRRPDTGWKKFPTCCCRRS